VRTELESYGAGLEVKPWLLVLSKADLADADLRTSVAEALRRTTGAEVLTVSATLREGLVPLLDRVLTLLEVEPAHAQPEDTDEAVRPWSPL
jgi:GTPase involved in cell partitioning and DNA repair